MVSRGTAARYVQLSTVSPSRWWRMIFCRRGRASSCQVWNQSRKDRRLHGTRQVSARSFAVSEVDRRARVVLFMSGDGGRGGAVVDAGGGGVVHRCVCTGPRGLPASAG